jgi:chromosome segregation ATPase
LNSAVLLSVVEQAKGGEFDQILSKLGDLADKLRTQNADEIAAQAECLQEMSNNEAERKKATQASLAASQKEIAEKAELGTNQAKVRRNQNRIKQLNAATKKFTDHHAKATQKNNKLSEISNTLLTQVTGGLEQLAHIDNVEVITNSLSDVKTKCEDDIGATKDRQHQSDAFLKENKEQNDNEVTALTAENEDLELANAQLTEDITDTEADRHVQQQSLSSFLGIFRDVLNKKCVANKFDPVEQFDQRNSARQAEIDALGRARSTLRGE